MMSLNFIISHVSEIIKVFQISELDQMKNNRPEAIIQENKCYGFEFFFPKSNFFIETLISFTL